MVRVYRETFSKGNQCFLRAETTMSSRSVQSEYKMRAKLDEENGVDCHIIRDGDYFAFMREEDADFITFSTISNIEVQ